MQKLIDDSVIAIERLNNRITLLESEVAILKADRFAVDAFKKQVEVNEDILNRLEKLETRKDR